MQSHFIANNTHGRPAMTNFKAEDEAIGTIVLMEELFQSMVKSGIVPAAVMADVVRGAVARLDTTDHFGAGAAVRHYFESWLSK
jgi:hypothetical protein